MDCYNSNLLELSLLKLVADNSLKPTKYCIVSRFDFFYSVIGCRYELPLHDLMQFKY